MLITSILIVIRSMRKNCIGGCTKWFAKGERFIASGARTHGYNGSRQSVIYDHCQFPSERIHTFTSGRYALLRARESRQSRGAGAGEGGMGEGG